MRINKFQLLLYAVSAASLLSMASAQQSIISVTFCGFVKGIQGIIGILAIALFLIGGVLYAVSHFLPSSLDFKKSLTSWSTSMIVGGVIGLIVVILAVPIVSTIMGIGTSVSGASSVNISC
jgi:hypothetical protein